MAAKARRQKPAPQKQDPQKQDSTAGQRTPTPQRVASSADSRAPLALLAAAIGVAVVAVVGAELVFGAISGRGGSPAASPAVSAAPASSVASATPAAQASLGVVVQGDGGTWVNVTPDELALMLKTKDFTFINVKTPYIGEIEGTDLWIPYDQLKARASELPADRGAKIVIYCRTGTTSAVGAQNLLELGYWNVWNLDDGMVAWQASGRTIVNKNR